MRSRLYYAGILKATRLPVPVIIVGNLFVGGTGKTPFVIWLVNALRQAGYTPGVISRGYGAHNDLARPVTAVSDPQVVGDEPVLIAARAACPVMVGRNRAAAAQALLAAYPALDVIVADDGLQHYALARDLEIVLFDARGAGNGWLLPAGPLREPLSRRRDFTVLNGIGHPPGMPPDTWRMQLISADAEQLCDRSNRIALQSPVWRDKRIVAAAGIGNPARFFSMLRGMDLHVEELPLPDHYDFSANPFAAIAADMILVTEKDAVKCARIENLENDPRIWVVPVTAHIERALSDQIVEKLRGYPTA